MRIQVSTRRQIVLDRFFPFGGSKKHRPHTALVHDSTAGCDQIEPLGHRCIRSGDCIIHLINECGNLEGHLDHAGLADFDSFVEGLMLTYEDSILDVLVDLPTVRRMNFLDVNGEEIDPIAVGAIDAIEGPSLGPKGRSGITPEDQRHWSICKSIRKSNRFALAFTLAGQERKLEIGSGLAGPGLRIRTHRLDFRHGLRCAGRAHRRFQAIDIQTIHVLGLTALDEIVEHLVNDVGRS
jgi:hypothetical protein